VNLHDNFGIGSRRKFSKMFDDSTARTAQQSSTLSIETILGASDATPFGIEVGKLRKSQGNSRNLQTSVLKVV
jgi:hypothetical protein